MFRSLFRLATSQPHLLADHVEAYAELVASEVGTVAGRWKSRVFLLLVGYGSLAVAVLLGAIALMLWAVVPTDSMNQPWVLVAVPLVPAVVGIGAAMRASGAVTEDPFSTLRRQWAADVAMLREAADS